MRAGWGPRCSTTRMNSNTGSPTRGSRRARPRGDGDAATQRTRTFGRCCRSFRPRRSCCIAQVTRSRTIEAGRYVASRIRGARFVELDGDDGIPWLGDVEPLLAEVENFVTDGARAGKAQRSTSRNRCSSQILSDRRNISLLSATPLGVGGCANTTASWHERSRVAAAGRSTRPGRRVRDVRRAGRGRPMCARRSSSSPPTRIRDPSRRPHRRGRERRRPRPRRCRPPRRPHRRGGRASQVLVSSTVRDLSAGSGLAFEDAGEHRLKGLESPGPCTSQVRLRSNAIPQTSADLQHTSFGRPT